MKARCCCGLQSWQFRARQSRCLKSGSTARPCMRHWRRRHCWRLAFSRSCCFRRTRSNGCPGPAEGAGLNPLLQDVGLAFHPPTLYFGYVGLSVAFSFAVGALLTGKVGPAFARAMRPWVLLAWIFLTLGITAGSYWAYYELGWGGWWFWDPVENASLMPWLAATALLHSVSVLATRNALRAWTIMLALVAFAMSMAGTFLVRSGILTSVHAFAVDPERGAFILALLLALCRRCLRAVRPAHRQRQTGQTIRFCSAAKARLWRIISCSARSSRSY